MLKRWVAWPQGTRWLAGGVAAAVLALAIAWVLLVPAADWLAHHDVGSVKGPALQAARDAARGRLLTLGAGLFAAGALLFTARNFILSREGQVTDRYTKAIEQLGSEKLDVRIGGIYALERIGRDSARDHPTVMEVLTAFIREHSQPSLELTGEPGGVRTTRPDVQAAATVVGRRDKKRDIQRINLSGADLTGAQLSGALLGGWIVTRGPFREYHPGADLSGAILGSAILSLADFTRADLTRADLTGADLRNAFLDGANLTDAVLTDANLSRADLTGANLTGAELTNANLAGARWPAGTPVPEGWKRDPSSSRLNPVDNTSGSAEAN